MSEELKNIERIILTAIFFIILLVAIVHFSKTTLTAVGIYSSITYSVAYFVLFGAALIFTKYIFYPMFRIYQYVALAAMVAVCGLFFGWLLHYL
jgi:hypothetical protein